MTASRPPVGFASRSSFPATLEELVEGARRGDAEATRAFVLALAPTILAAARRVVGARHPDIEDIAQDAVIHVLDALPGFRADCSIRHFVCRITTNRALAARRHARYRETWTPAVAPEWVDQRASAIESTPVGEDELLDRARRQAIRQLLDHLPEAQAEAVALYFIMGFTAEEVAETTGTPIPTVRSRIRLARDALKARIEQSEALQDMLRGTA